MEGNSYISLKEELAREVEEKLPPEEEMQNLAEFYKVFGDSTRLKIMFALLCSELCVYDIALLFGMGQSAISHQLRILKQSRLIKCRRQGKNILYSLADDHVRRIIDQGLEHIEERG